MKVVFSGFEHPVVLHAGCPAVLEVANRTLFTRVCRSLLSGAGEDALEPYSLWDDGGVEVAPAKAFLSISDPLNLPWDNKALAGRLHDSVVGLAYEDEELRMRLDSLAGEMAATVSELMFQVNGSYGFGVEWGLKKYLKAFSFAVEQDPSASYLDSLILFLDFCADMRLDKALLFVNLKIFLSENDLMEFYERVFFHGFEVLILENVHDDAYHEHEIKMCIDQHFLEH